MAARENVLGEKDIDVPAERVVGNEMTRVRHQRSFVWSGDIKAPGRPKRQPKLSIGLTCLLYFLEV